MRRLTERRRQILAVFTDAAAQGRPMPTVREIGRRVGLASTATVQKHIAALRDAGYLSESNMLARCTAPTAKARELAGVA